MRGGEHEAAAKESVDSCNRATGTRHGTREKQPKKYEGGGPKRGHIFSTSRPYRTMMPGGSAIPGSRATGATTSTITRDCDRPIDEGRRPREGPTMRQGRRVRQKRRDATESQRQQKRSNATEGEGSSSRRVRRVQLTKSARGEGHDEIPWC